MNWSRYQSPQLTQSLWLPVTPVTSYSGYQSLWLPVTLVTSHSSYQTLRSPVTVVTLSTKIVFIIMHKLVTFGHIGNNSSHLGDTLQLRVGVTGVTGDWTSYGYLRKGVTGFGNCSEWVPSPVTPVTPVTLVTSHSGYQSLRLPVTLVTSHSSYQSLQLPVTVVTLSIILL